MGNCQPGKNTPVKPAHTTPTTVSVCMKQEPIALCTV